MKTEDTEALTCVCVYVCRIRALGLYHKTSLGLRHKISLWDQVILQGLYV